jgi:hypothetical protein
MISHPSAGELLEAVRLFIEEAAQGLGAREAFLARVASNALKVVGRELAEAPALEAEATDRLRELLGRSGDVDSLNKELCQRIRDGDFDELPGPLLDHLHASAVAQVRIDQPTYSGLAAALAANRPGVSERETR